MSLVYFLHRLNCHIKDELGLKKFGAHSCRAPNVHQTLIGGAQSIVHQHYFSWQSIYSTPSSNLYGHKQN